MSKVAPPPMKAGQMHPNNNHVAREHKAHGLVWDLPNHKKAKEDDEILQLGRQWLQTQPAEHHGLIKEYVNSILNNPDRHIRHGADSPTGPEVARSRHLKQLFQGHPDVKFSIDSPTSLSFSVVRHGTNPKISQFRYDASKKVAKSEALWYTDFGAIYADEDGNRYSFSNRDRRIYVGGGEASTLGKNERNEYEGADYGSKLERIFALSMLLRSNDASGLPREGSNAGSNGALSGDESRLLKAEEKKVHSGVMIALPIPSKIAEKLALQNGESAEDLHVTLLYIPKIGNDDEKFYKLASIVADAAKEFASFDCKIGGLGRFSASDSSDGKDVFYAGFDATVLPELRQYIFDKAKDSGIEWSSNFGYTPHVTLKYIDKSAELPMHRMEPVSFHMDKIIIKATDKFEEETFSGERIAKSEELASYFTNLIKADGKFITKPKFTQKEWYNKSKKDKKAHIHRELNPNPADKIPLKDTIASVAADVFKDKIKKEELDKGFGGVKSPKPSHTIAQLQNLQREGWHNANTGYEMSAEEGTTDLHQKLQNKADKQVKRTLRDIYKPKKVTGGGTPEDFFGKKEELEKSKNVRIQRKAVFGPSGEPSPDKKATKQFHAKQSAALNQLAQKRYGVELAPASGKMNYTVPKFNKERKKQGLEPMTEQQLRADPNYQFADPKVTDPSEHGNFRPKQQKSNPKPDWRSGKLEAQRHVGAKAHEMGHLEIMPENVKLGDAQTLMDEGTKTVGSKFGAAAKQTQYEIQPMAAEEALRRRAGIPQFGRPQTTDPTRGKSTEPLTMESPERVALDDGQKYARRSVENGVVSDRIGMASNLTPENRARMRDVDEGIMSFHPGEGWTQSNSTNALINLRGQGRHREAVNRLKAKYARKSELTKTESLAKKDWHASYTQHMQQPNKLVHYSKKKGLKTLDPTFHGTGVKGAESRWGKPAVPRTYYYEHGTQPEDIVTSGAVAKYTATLQPHHRIYDIGHDRDGIYNKLKEASMNRQVNAGMVSDDDFMQAIKDAGYYGFKNSKGALPNAVGLFHAHDVDTESEPFAEGHVDEKVSR